MQTTKLGATGLEVSRLCLGCMSFGAPDRANHTWTLAEEDSRGLITTELSAGEDELGRGAAVPDGGRVRRQVGVARRLLDARGPCVRVVAAST